ncbi:hypothetical protein BCR32DRAFT_247564 [Anaeromyces robustus]|uniref:Uncharacterized protein n=1 Tax=Anaeromyces robustus TaxID=1754192 RepID=A0A1Y1WWG6_9FUNG|nr:hypothetical protein BCR32DRAFT_247564 [Anaeromyces robustus]|eukprot:ORX77901.1 hypothetical protein BCR32DRAFT_247564 [Anaeromyces robustus]
MTTTTEKNTDLFYKELNGDCNENVLLEIAKKGIFLYESLFNHDKLKNHDYVIDISILARQYFMINTESQYEHFFEIMENFEKYNIFSLYKNRYYCGKLIIMNKFFINKLYKEKNDQRISLILNSYHNSLILKNLYKYKIISSNIYYLFIQTCKHYCINYEIFDYFYFNNLNYVFEKEEFSCGFDKLFYKISTILEYAYDINILKYCLELLNNANMKMPSSIRNSNKIPLNFPLKLLKLYSSKIYMPSQVKVKHDNELFEDLLNTIYSDYKLYNVSKCPWVIYDKFNEKMLNRYNINFDTVKKQNIKVETIGNIDITQYFLYHCYSEFKSIKYHKANSKKEKLFSKYILTNYDEIQNILDDFNYIFTLDINFNKEIFLIQISFIISLIHNKYNKFIIKYLLSAIYVRGSNLVFENNKIIVYYANDNDIYDNENYFNVLLDVPHEVFKNYIEFKKVKELTFWGENDQDEFIYGFT